MTSSNLIGLVRWDACRALRCSKMPPSRYELQVARKAGGVSAAVGDSRMWSRTHVEVQYAVTRGRRAFSFLVSRMASRLAEPAGI